MERREFLRLAAIGSAGLVAGAGGATPAVAAPILLSPSDLNYRGFFLLPADPDGTRFGWSNGALACRNVGGEPRVFITGAHPNGDYVYEVAYPGTVGSTAAAAPRAAMVRAWGDIYQGRRLNDRSSLGPITKGLLWSNGALWWSYGGEYNVAGIHDPSIGASFLNDSTGAVSAFGPWRTSEHSQRTRGYMVNVPGGFSSQYVGGRSIAVGAPPTSGNSSSPMGAWLSALATLNPATTPADFVGDTHVTIGCQNLIAHDVYSPMSRPAGSRYRVCNGGNLSSDPTFKNSVGTDMVAFDSITAAAWVQTSTKEGLVMFGQIADVVPGMTYPNDTMPHMWYGTEGTPCPHGHTSTIGSGTGPKCASMVPYAWIFDPATLAMSAQGALAPQGVSESVAVPLHSLAPGIKYPVAENYALGGACFDPVSGLLFLSEVQADTYTNRYEPRPVIHVFDMGESRPAVTAPTNLRLL